MTTPSILNLLSQHPILLELSSYLSTLDLFHLALASRYCHSLILGSPRLFEVLKRQCLCDGRGLRHQIAAHNRGENPESGSKYSYTAGLLDDEPIEVHLYARRCDEAGALPCLRCGINVCEECRVYPRTLRDDIYGRDRRPHLNSCWFLGRVFCLCPACDVAMETRLQDQQFLQADRCDCDIYCRWICRKCSRTETREEDEYRRNNTKYEGDHSETKVMGDHQDAILLFCPCGSTIPQDAVPRCWLCSRRHRPEGEWQDEFEEMGANTPPYVDNGGSYPRYSSAYSRGITWDGYPRLKYQGPIHQATGNVRDTVVNGEDEMLVTDLPLRSSQRKQGPVTQGEFYRHRTAGGWEARDAGI